MLDPKDFPAGAIGISSGYTSRYAAFDACLHQLLKPPGTKVKWETGVNFEFNWNQMIRNLPEDCEWFWIMGDDHVFAPDLLLKLLDRNVDVVVPLCLHRAHPFMPVIRGQRDEPRDFVRVDWKPIEGKSGLLNLAEVSAEVGGTLIPKMVTGNAGMLIRRSVFDRLPAPWFEVGQVDRELRSSDLHFCRKLHEAGIGLYLDCDNPIGHILDMAVWPARNDTGEWTPELRLPTDLEAKGPNMGLQRGERNWAATFNGWRRTYDTTPYRAQQEFYNVLYEHFPTQNAVNVPALDAFLSDIVAQGRQPSVIEIGGWRGETAARFLDRYPTIKGWTNIEICPRAVDNTVAAASADKRYLAFAPDIPAWEVALPMERYDTAVLSHVLEHMKVAEVEKLLARIVNVTALYIDCPIPEQSRDVNWRGFTGAHILEVGWDMLEPLVRRAGFKHFRRTGSVLIATKAERQLKVVGDTA